MFSLVPEPARASVRDGLRIAFGQPGFDTPPVLLRGGLSGAVLLRIRVGGIDYALKIEGPPGPFSNLSEAYACMRAAADLMLAPRVWYTDAEAGVTIMDLLPQAPFASFPGGRQALIVELAQTVRVLHQAPPFPRHLVVLDGVDTFIRPEMLDGVAPAAQARELFSQQARLKSIYRTHERDRVSSHLDLNPANLVFDGRRLWLIDWYSAFVADRFMDLAAVVNWFAPRPEDEDLLTTAYFGAPMDAAQAARLRVMRQVNHLFLGMMFVNGALAERPNLRREANLFSGPDLETLGARLMSGTLDMGDPADRLAYGRARLGEALRAGDAEPLEKALALVA